MDSPTVALERCRACSALLAAGADWCGQCYAPTAVPVSVSAPEPAPATPAELTDDDIAAMLAVPESLRAADPSFLDTLRSRNYGVGAIVGVTLLLTALLCGALVLPRVVAAHPTRTPASTSGPLAGIPATPADGQGSR
ncbi:hypothetical protein CLV35_1455 [Motilibacter peucedani]|uniref:Uncharacterized protein n=1 Tax=Motilibacter peucedani TaxID=598650 RepID=A0A420XSH8_9ACTN|nr:hypothetical protein [Motilibacter peucedani]RKS77757.1 hypothetical protein CLV35_1455 [Motilibacter peucedani]